MGKEYQQDGKGTHSAKDRANLTINGIAQMKGESAVSLQNSAQRRAAAQLRDGRSSTEIGIIRGGMRKDGMMPWNS
jgi:hypothetical protein